MLVITIEMLPGGDTQRRRLEGVIVIANDGTGTLAKGNYQASLSHTGKYQGKRKEPWKNVKVKGFDRTHNVYELIRKVIEAAEL